MFNRKEFNERIQQEFEEYKNEMLQLEVEDNFELGFEIDFKTNLTEFLQNEEIVSDENAEKINAISDNILDYFLEEYLNTNDSDIFHNLFDEIVTNYVEFFETSEDDYS